MVMKSLAFAKALGQHVNLNTILVSQVLDEMAWFLNRVSRNNREVFVIRMADTWNTNVDRLVQYLKAAFPGTNGKTGLNDYYNRTGRWPTIEQAIKENQRVFITAQNRLCNANCRAKYRFFINVSDKQCLIGLI